MEQNIECIAAEVFNNLTSLCNLKQPTNSRPAINLEKEVDFIQENYNIDSFSQKAMQLNQDLANYSIFVVPCNQTHINADIAKLANTQLSEKYGFHPSQFGSELDVEFNLGLLFGFYGLGHAHLLADSFRTNKEQYNDCASKLCKFYLAFAPEQINIPEQDLFNLVSGSFECENLPANVKNPLVCEYLTRVRKLEKSFSKLHNLMIMYKSEELSKNL